MNKFPEARDLIWDESIKLTRLTLEHAAGWIDKELGKGFSKQHPELLASFISATMTGYAGAVIAAAIEKSGGGE
jgi:hypothetical protein